MGSEQPGDTSQLATPEVGIDGLTQTDRQRLRRRWAAVAAPVLLLNWWVLTAGRWSPLRTRQFGDFFDAQTRSLMKGRWDVPPEVPGFEGVLVDGKTHVYFGPFPALLRMPLFALTDRFDGRLTVLSMFAAMVVLTVAAYRLSTAVRAFVLGHAPVTRRELFVTPVLAVAALTGVPFWMASLTIVHHEASMWGVALTVLALDALARWLLDPSGFRLAVASAFIGAASLSRISMGFGALAALGVVSLLVLVDRVRARGGPPRVTRVPVATPIWALLIAGIVPLAVAVVPNMARFDHPFDVPVDRQVYGLENVERQEFLGAAGGSFWHPQFVPTTLRQYFRPDAFSLRGELPWIDYPNQRPEPVGDVLFDGLEWSSSVTTTMPALTVLAVLGVAWFVVAFRRRRPEVWLVPLWIGAVVAASGVITIGHIAHRYLNDLYPMLLLPALVAFYKLLAWAPRAQSQKHIRLRQAVTAGLAVLVGVGTVATTAMALQFQRERGPMIAESTRAGWVQLRANLPFAKVPELVDLGDPLPSKTWESRVAVVGDCDGVYIRVDDRWQPVERGPEVGVYRLRLDVDALGRLEPGKRAPLLTLGTGRDATVVAVTRSEADLVRVDVWPGPDEGWLPGRAQAMEGTVELRVVSDHYAPPSAVYHGSEAVYYGLIPGAGDGTPVEIGRAGEDAPPGVEDRYPGDVELVPADHSVCHAFPGTGSSVGP